MKNILTLGKKIKEYRLKCRMTLKDLSEKTGLSAGFLSQLERGMSTVAIDSLMNIAKALDTNIKEFFSDEDIMAGEIVRSYEREVLKIHENGYIHYLLTASQDTKNILPRVVEILPQKNTEKIQKYSHEGEEFVFVLEGILTLYLAGDIYELYPGDSAHYISHKPHNWQNRTNKTVKILSVNSPNFLKEGRSYGF